MTQVPAAEYDQTSIVMLGSFNPRIFHPSWFVRHGLLPPEAEAESKIDLINNDICAFQTDWCRFEIINERFAIHTLVAPVVGVLRDLTQSTFEILSHTPIARVGLNTAAHFALAGPETWHDFGHAMAPKSTLWDPILKDPGTLTLTIQGQRPDHYKGHVNVKVEPSARVQYGLFIETNEEFHAPEGVVDAGWTSPLFDDVWEAVQERSHAIRNHLLKEALAL